MSDSHKEGTGAVNNVSFIGFDPLFSQTQVPKEIALEDSKASSLSSPGHQDLRPTSIAGGGSSAPLAGTRSAPATGAGASSPAEDSEARLFTWSTTAGRSTQQLGRSAAGGVEVGSTVVMFPAAEELGSLLTHPASSRDSSPKSPAKLSGNGRRKASAPRTSKEALMVIKRLTGTPLSSFVHTAADAARMETTLDYLHWMMQLYQDLLEETVVSPSDATDVAANACYLFLDDSFDALQQLDEASLYFTTDVPEEMRKPMKKSYYTDLQKIISCWHQEGLRPEPMFLPKLGQIVELTQRLHSIVDLGCIKIAFSRRVRLQAAVCGNNRLIPIIVNGLGITFSLLTLALGILPMFSSPESETLRLGCGITLFCLIVPVLALHALQGYIRTRKAREADSRWRREFKLAETGLAAAIFAVTGSQRSSPCSHGGSTDTLRQRQAMVQGISFTTQGTGSSQSASAGGGSFVAEQAQNPALPGSHALFEASHSRQSSISTGAGSARYRLPHSVSKMQVALGTSPDGRTIGAQTTAANDYLLAVGYDSDGTIVVWNQAIMSASGISQVEAIGEKITTYLDLEEPHRTRNVAYFQLFTVHGRLNLRGTVAPLYSDELKIGHVLLAPAQDSQVMRVLHDYRIKRMVDIMQDIHGQEGVIELMTVQLGQMTRLLHLTQWSELKDLAEKLDREWKVVSRSDVLDTIRRASEGSTMGEITVSKMVPEALRLDSDLLSSMLTTVLQNRKGTRVSLDGKEFGEEYVAMQMTLTAGGGAYPFSVDEMEDLVGVELRGLGAHLSASFDANALTMEFPGVVNLPKSQLGDRVNPPRIVITVWGADATIVRGLSAEFFERQLPTEHLTLRVLNPNTVTTECLHRSLRSCDCLITTGALLDGLRTLLVTALSSRSLTSPLMGGSASASVGSFLPTGWCPLIYTVVSAGESSTSPSSPATSMPSSPAPSLAGASIIGEIGKLSFPFAEDQLQFLLDRITSKRSEGTTLEYLWSQGGLLGRGASGAVYEGVISGSQSVAVKRINKQHISSKDIWREVEILSSLSHANIISYYFVEETAEHICVALELCAGSLNDLRPPPEKVPRIVRELLQALSYLHASGIIHRDVKTANLLVSLEGHVKLTDFGVSADQVDPELKEMAGTYRFMAPEVFKGQKASFASDVWSVGCVFCDLLDALPDHMKKKQHLKLLSMTHVDLPRKIRNSLFRNFLSACFQVVPTHRPSVDRLLEEYIFEELTSAANPLRGNSPSERSYNGSIVDASRSGSVAETASDFTVASSRPPQPHLTSAVAEA